MARHLREHPDVERLLMTSPVETLTPADQFFRALVLEEREQYAEAQALAERARAGLYTAEYRTCAAAEQRYLAQQLASDPGPVVDLAAGRGELVATLAREMNRPILATDFSPTVLRRTQRRLQTARLAGRVSLLACDARRLPFRDGAISTLTTNLGLPNSAGPARPTPCSILLDGATIDGLPLADTVLEWCVLVAH